MKVLLLTIIAWIVVVGVATAVPTTGVATDVNSNGFNSSVTGVTGTDVWIMWGDFSGKENWMTPIGVASAGSATISVIGAPIYGGENVVFQACDNTGCGNERTVTIPAITPMPTTTYSKLVKNITNSRFQPTQISFSMVSVYTTVAPFALVIGIAMMFFMIGIWTRTKSVRLIAILGILIAPFVMLGDQGLYLGVPSVGILVAKGLLAAAFAGIMLAFMRK